MLSPLDVFTVPVLGLGVIAPNSTGSYSIKQSDGSSAVKTGWSANSYSNAPTAGQSYVGIEEGASGFPNIRADLTANTVATINALRSAEAIQTLLETDMRGGALYTQMIFAHFGVVSSDSRLQRSEYLGGNSVPVNMSPVLQTSETGATPQGNLAGMGTLNSHDVKFVKSFEEHGYIIGVVFARSDIHYQQGLERHWSRSTRYDFYLPELAHLGEQAILNKEIFLQGTSSDNDVFGYTERWAEMKSDYSLIVGTLNSDTPSSLDVWHYAQDFSALPSLNSTFLKDGTPELRIQSVPTESTFVGDFQFDANFTRVMPAYSIPGWSARF